MGAWVGGGVDVGGAAVGLGLGVADAAADPGDAEAAGDDAGVVVAADGVEQAIATRRVAARPDRRGRIKPTLATS